MGLYIILSWRNETTEDGITNLPNRLAKAAGLPKWKHNALRHSYGSYHLALPGHLVKTAFQMGNSPVVYNHYKGLVSNGDVKTYWSLRPAESAEKIVPMQAAASSKQSLDTGGEGVREAVFIDIPPETGSPTPLRARHTLSHPSPVRRNR